MLAAPRDAASSCFPFEPPTARRACPPSCATPLIERFDMICDHRRRRSPAIVPPGAAEGLGSKTTGRAARTGLRSLETWWRTGSQLALTAARSRVRGLLQQRPGSLRARFPSALGAAHGFLQESLHLVGRRVDRHRAVQLRATAARSARTRSAICTMQSKKGEPPLGDLRRLERRQPGAARMVCLADPADRRRARPGAAAGAQIPASRRRPT